MPKEDEFSSFINNLSDYEKSLQEEYETAIQSDEQSNVRKVIEQKIAQAMPGFVDDLILIARTGDTDSTRLKAISFAFDWYFSGENSVTDPFSVLLSELTNNDPATKNNDKTPKT